MKTLPSLYSVRVRFFAEVGLSGILAFVIVSTVLTITSPAPLSLAYMISIA